MRERLNVLLRASLLTLAVLGVSTAQAQVRTREIDVVKIMSFSCSVCLAAEAQDRSIAAAVTAKHGKFIWAPVPTQDEDTGARERTYYAARDLDPALGSYVKASIFKGSQERGLALFDFMQLYSWLQQDLPDQEKQLDALFKRAQAEESAASLRRAIRLALNAGSQGLPSYIILVNGEIKATLDPSSANAGSLSALRDLVISRVDALSKE